MNYADSFDLVTRSHGGHWQWAGLPMTVIEGTRRRLKHRLKLEPNLEWRIVLMRLNRSTGEVVLSIVDEGGVL